MRGLLTFIGLLVALGVTAILMRKQMTSVQMPVPVLQAPTGTPATAVTPVPGNATQQSQQIQQQYKQALEAATQARPMPDNDK
ncbi:MAG: hypothetical protein JZU64_03600 [Rhodoferax sp.]|jgi:hypothetical protein|nr:hypothetical protein [Rhodoferax sp.]